MNMWQGRSLILALLWHVVSAEGGFTNNWSNWIILPARSSGSANSFVDFRLNRSGVVSNYLDPVKVEPYFMRIKNTSEKKKEWQIPIEEDDDDKTGDELIVPLGRAIENVKSFWAILKDLFGNDNFETEGQISTSRKIKKLKKKYKKLLLPLLIAYKLKFLTLIPVLIGGLILLVGTTGLAGFFFALFAAVMSLKNNDSKVEIKKW